MKQSLWWSLSWTCLLPAAGCATYSSYRCPEPIGEIVRQDCDDYRLRYESLAAKVKFSIGSVTIGAEVGSEKLRDPSELIQVMMQRMLALCHDFNACRVDSRDYQRRREEADQAFTAVMAVLEQLKNPALTPPERQRMIGELLAILKGAPAPAPAPPPDQRRQEKPAEREFSEGFFRDSTGYWYQSKLRPPQPPPAQPGVPALLEVTASKNGAFFSHLFVRFFGAIEADDLFFVTPPGKEELRCHLTAAQKKPEATANCNLEKHKLPFGPLRLAARYFVGAKEQSFEPGAIDVDPRAPTARAWLAFQPDPVRKDPITRERPWLLITLVSSQHPSVTARCFENGKPVLQDGAAVLKAYGDRASAYGSPVTRVSIPLPYVAPYPEGSPEGDELWVRHAGEWRCKVSVDGEPYQEVRFKVKPDGSLEPHPDQQGRPGNVASPWWLLDTRDITEKNAG